MKKRLMSILGILALVVTTFVATSHSEAAQATATWPQQFTQLTDGGVTAFGEDDLAILNCSEGSSSKAAIRIKDGAVTSSLDGFGTSGYLCDGSEGLTTKDGTFYGYKSTGYT